MTLLEYRDPGEFRNQQVLIEREGGTYSFSPVGEVMSFAQMMSLRKRTLTAEHLEKSFQDEGYVFANLGVSAVLVAYLGSEDYAVLVRQNRTDLGDSVLKLLSGYVPAKDVHQPVHTIEEEISEELLPVTPDRKVIRFSCNGKVQKPFGNSFPDHGREIYLASLRQTVLGGLVDCGCHGNPQMYFQLPSNSAQLVFGYHFDLTPLMETGFTLHHTEEVFTRGRLEVRMTDDAYLIKLEDNRLTDNVFKIIEGKLKSVDPRNIILSEAFAEKKQGMVEKQNISLLELLV